MTYLRYLALVLVLCIAVNHAEAAPETYTVDATHSAALFRVKHFVIKRTDYGMDKLLLPAGDKIQITLLVEAMCIDPPPEEKTEK